MAATPAEEFVVPVVEALLGDSPPRVVRGGVHSLRRPLLKRLLPDAMFDAKLVKLFGLDQLGGAGRVIAPIATVTRSPCALDLHDHAPSRHCDRSEPRRIWRAV